MGFFTNRKTKQVFKVKSDGDGRILGPIGTPITNTSQEDKIRLINRITSRNKEVKESHEERIRREKLAKAEFDKKQKQRHDQQQAIIDEIETRRRLLKQAKNDPEILDKLQGINPKGGSLPKDFTKEQSKKQKEFFKEEIDKLNNLKESETKSINNSKDTIEMNNNQIEKKKNELEEIKKHSSNIPEINQQNTKLINELVMEIGEFEKNNDEWNKDIDQSVNTLKNLERDSQKIKFLDKDTAFGTIGTLPNQDRDTLPKGVAESRARAKESFETRKTGKGTTPIFPAGFQTKRKVKNPFTGKEFFTSQVPENKKFVGFEKNGDPVFVDKLERKERVEPTERVEIIDDKEESEGGKRFSIIQGLAKERGE